ncbi:MAG: hypothetical protein WBX11_15555 [Thiobacillaceae bacterium]
MAQLGCTKALPDPIKPIVLAAINLVGKTLVFLQTSGVQSVIAAAANVKIAIAIRQGEALNINHPLWGRTDRPSESVQTGLKGMQMMIVMP